MTQPLKTYVLITGGAGFIGTNLAQRLSELGQSVLIYDNLSRAGVEENLQWLIKKYPRQIQFIREDIRDELSVQKAVERADAVFHLAAQVAVTHSLDNPVHDFEVNAKGTLNVLEAIRKRKEKPFLLYTSTNKVLGGLNDIRLQETEHRYIPIESQIQKWGIGEDRRIEFCSPYGCSKGSADQYVLDYARCYDLPATVFRMSCIYGPHQCGNEDQGWVAHFIKQVIGQQTITFYGNGKQVRDVLHVDDLIDALLLAWKNKDQVQSEAFNIGGGPGSTTSLIELITLLSEIDGKIPEVKKEGWRASDQKYYVSDIRKYTQFSGWTPKISLQEGIQKLHEWFSSH